MRLNKFVKRRNLWQTYLCVQFRHLQVELVQVFVHKGDQRLKTQPIFMKDEHVTSSFKHAAMLGVNFSLRGSQAANKTNLHLTVSEWHNHRNTILQRFRYVCLILCMYLHIICLLCVTVPHMVPLRSSVPFWQRSAYLERGRTGCRRHHVLQGTKAVYYLKKEEKKPKIQQITKNETYHVSQRKP